MSQDVGNPLLAVHLGKLGRVAFISFLTGSVYQRAGRLVDVTLEDNLRIRRSDILD